ncbi:FecR family protein [Lysobacter sp.]|uniref:FecR family protein n=1 Tax=Lysobacter sp. TaxID=72226 RepID=UPI002D7290A0|nr:FecR domain-containing protein [Lysobacter sp.]HZX78165.1 FecR domain-containing protein [Lysobacter sp.]
MTERNPAPGRIAEEALEWHARQRQGGLQAAQQAEFMEWLVASPEHLREYLAVGRLAAELADAMRAMPADARQTGGPSPARADNVVALPTRRRTHDMPVSSPRRAHGRRWLAAAVLVLTVGVAVRMAIPQSAHYAAEHGEPRRVELPDGTVAHLNAESAMRVRFGLFGRRIELERGQASFVVAPDRRPLSVHAAGLQMQDIGTTFDVSLQREQARIGVAEGRVQVIGEDGEGRMLADLHAGQSARVAYRDLAVTVRDEDVDTMTAWWTRRIVFHDESLRDVADAFNRLNGTRLQVDDAAGAMRLTGNLRADDLASMRAFLDQQPMLVTRATAGGIEVSARVSPVHASRASVPSTGAPNR